LQDPDVEDLNRRVLVSQAMLDRVIHTTDNLDEKVGRVFTSMSFMIVGATILFTSFVTNKLLCPVDGIDLVPLVFLAFMVSVAVATGYMLLAMGPRFRLIPWGSKPRLGSLTPSPTGYADKIASMKEAEWKDYFTGIPNKDLYEKWFKESMEETYALSQKVHRKAGEMRKAQGAFSLAILLLIAMIVLAISQLF
jgi:hypothetical protein